MKPERILVPLDVAKCPLAVFKVVNGFAERPGVTIILLHAVNLNIQAPENRVYEELGREAHWQLERLAERYVTPMASILIRVRVGKPTDEIVATAKEENADLIILPVYQAPLWKRLFTPFFPKIVVKVIRQAPCGVFVMDVKTRLNCKPQRGLPVNGPNPALDHSAETSETRSFPLPPPTHSLAAT